jgi:hypothetical protein
MAVYPISRYPRDTEAPHDWWVEDGYTFIDAFVHAYETVWAAAAATGA